MQPLFFPIFLFALTILAGAGLLVLPISLGGQAVSWTDALFTATSATCVTGLTVMDTATGFSRFGQTVILVLMQVGGLGIMTITSLAMYLLHHRVTLTDRVAVGQNLLQDPKFQLGRFLLQIVLLTGIVELSGTLLLRIFTKGEMDFFSSLFHSVAAFCNAGFSLHSDSLVRYAHNWPVNLVFMLLIILGGIGFFVLVDTGHFLRTIFSRGIHDHRSSLSRYSRLVLTTSAGLILGGTLALLLAEWVLQNRSGSFSSHLLPSLFQSVSCRTAGFNTIDFGAVTNVSLLLMINLMFIGGAAGSCAGGIKISTWRVLVAFLYSELRGREQTVIGAVAVNRRTVRKSLALFSFSTIIITVAILALSVSETGNLPQNQSRGQFLQIAFEAVSAFGTVGLSTGLTPALSIFGKYVVILLMFIGRLGPLLLIAALQNIQHPEIISRPEEDFLVG